MDLSPTQVIVLATPVFFLLIGLEFAWGLWRGKNTYRLNDAINSISLGTLSEISKVLTRLLRVGIYTAVFSWVSVWHNEAFWTSIPGWILALLFYDFCYYWLHRAGHEVAVFWAAHVVHHQSQDYNLSTALRQTSSGALLGWVFYLPMAMAGVPPAVFAVVALIDLLYQFWVHTEHVPKLGWFDRWFVSPSNHRVHHAVNDEYLDRNYGGILVVWDRLFGSFREEDAKCVYGTRAPLESWDPLWSNFEVYWALARDSWHARSWGDKLRVWFKPPGWRPADVAERFPRTPFAMERVTRYHPPMTRAVAWFAAIQFGLLLQGATLFLWRADQMALSQSVVWLVALGAALWAVGAVMQGRLGMLEVLLVEAAALATATAADGMIELHRVFKPLAMVLAIALVASRPGWMRQDRAFDLKLLAALLLCLAGDVFLMLPGPFIPGLVSFLCAHLCYLALFRQGQPWFASRRALAGTLAAAVVMYAILFPHLGPVLQVAVAAYALVIALMAAQAIGRATVLRDPAAMGVAVGAVFFMLSDALLAINRFAQPLPMAQFLVLATYYVAQVLIVRNVRGVGAERWGELRSTQPTSAASAANAANARVTP
ncbi:sterol desaturase family protein [Ramlibacter sp. USB13]|uniref:Sterol desaturase family protein n=1 Tax=Ramlibacter cellulosilyticus TaxID=2764187 RepID=A0A923SCX1_9BURK|nr:lysoplasmalogenase family protein [Ramlibacter cellulosilyticus]MBC5784723.1 sterol desaturase family protein [Ramlibacter cellulosilyticus]